GLRLHPGHEPAQLVGVAAELARLAGPLLRYRPLLQLRMREDERVRDLGLLGAGELPACEYPFEGPDGRGGVAGTLRGGATHALDRQALMRRLVRHLVGLAHAGQRVAGL